MSPERPPATQQSGAHIHAHSLANQCLPDKYEWPEKSILAMEWCQFLLPKALSYKTVCIAKTIIRCSLRALRDPCCLAVNLLAISLMWVIFNIADSLLSVSIAHWMKKERSDYSEKMTLTTLPRIIKPVPTCNYAGFPGGHVISCWPMRCAV